MIFYFVYYYRYFVTENDKFIDNYNANHTQHKYYILEIEKVNKLKYIKEKISKSPNKCAINPKLIYTNIKVWYPNTTNSFLFN